MTSAPAPTAPGATTAAGAPPAVAGVAVFAARPAQLAAAWEDVLGIELDHRVHADGREHWIASLAGVQVELKALRTAAGEQARDATGDEASGTSRSELSFTVPDVDAAFERALELGWQANQAPERFDWGTFGTVLDPEGNRIGLYTPPAHEREGGEG